MQLLGQREIFQGVLFHALAAVGIQSLAAWRMEIPFPLLTAATLGIWWMVTALSFGWVMAYLLLPVLGIRIRWPKAMAYILTSSALWIPFGATAAMVGLWMPRLLVAALSLFPLLLSLWGFWRVFRPSRKRLWALSAAGAVALLLVVASSGVAHHREVSVPDRVLAGVPEPGDYGTSFQPREATSSR